MKEKEQRNILIIEDEVPLQKAIGIKMEKAGFGVLSARKVEQALKYMKDKDFGKISAIWLDHYLLGQKNGLVFVSKIKQNKKWRNIPVYLVSNTADPDKIHAYLELGVDKYYLKANCDLNSIIREIKNKTNICQEKKQS